ncbi:GyrI-like domain-containing protein [Jhaorihella thermophila]|uniref:AraC family transcriptional regulator n=1 Tax=Jhaorihella thermophila TaxID=488547 RepID=A0A1H5V8L2_9RHOB|nr:GyrI-like domain-containing protein [Jhaorihella thermophila]SEF83101.1 AraC family transcriptional regulator [Jhaorihella thermophila]
MEPEIETAPERRLVGFADAFTVETRHRIGELWQAFLKDAQHIRNRVPGALYGVSFSADGKGGFRYAVAVEVDPLPEQRPQRSCVVTLSAGKYAVLRRFAPIEELPRAFDEMFTEWLPGSGWCQREGAVFERYPDDPRNGPDGVAWEIWVPVQA